ncbi:MAG: hypothetical protein J6Y69_08495 [Treponema sp.]|nr:hypothetical protein [Treponema sp.]
MEKEVEKNDRSWVFVCIIICILGATLAGTTMWGRQFNWREIVIVAVAALLGLLIGIIFKNRGKSGKTISFILCALIFGVLVGGAKYLNSDAYLVKQPWQKQAINKVHFSYPGEFSRNEIAEELQEKGTRKIYTIQTKDRFAHYMEYDFTDEYPTLEESVKNVVTSMTGSLRASTSSIKWSKDAYITDSIFKSRFTYTYNRKTFTGFAFGYEEGNHCEIAAFYPLKKPFSDAFLKKIEDSITIE